MRVLALILGWLVFVAVGGSIASLPGTGWPAASAAEPVQFESDLVPIFTKLGCNSGACHGAAAGRGGFNLSLYGSDPMADFRAIVEQHRGRRVNLSRPNRSLILLKPSEAIAHEGGYLIEDDDMNFELIRRWIEQGAKFKSDRKLARVEVQPRVLHAPSTGTSVQLSCTAHFRDGSRRDVTPWTVFHAEDESSVAIDSKTAVATIPRRGRHIVVARFLGEVVPIEIIVPLTDRTVTYASESSASFVDKEIYDRLETLGLPISGEATDAAFLRRLTLDLTGRLPSSLTAETRGQIFGSEVHQVDFAKGVRDRNKLITVLLSSEEFAEYWTFKLAKLLRIRPQGGRDPNQGAAAMYVYHNWLREQVSSGVGYDQIVRELLLAQGDTAAIGPASFYRTVNDPREHAEFVSELFMGTRLRCANCHDHPLDQWTQDDYHGLAAILAKVDMGKVVRAKPRGEVIHPKSSRPARGKIPGGDFVSADVDARVLFANWLTDRDNPYFAKAIVNRIWQHLMGRGLVEPVDDFRATNPATHAGLLDQLSADFVEHNFDLRHTIRQIVSSDAYGRSVDSVPGNQNDQQFYSRWIRKPLEPEVLADCMSDVLGLEEKYGDLPQGIRAVQIVNVKTPSRTLDVLGRCSREESCESGPSGADGLRQKLHLLNGPLLNERLASSRGRLGDLVREASPMQVIEEFYELAFTRSLQPDEQSYWRQQLSGEDESGSRRLLEDFVWSLLTCEEFVTNH